MSRKLFLTSSPHGKMTEVETLGPSKHMKDAVYIRYIDGRGFRKYGIQFNQKTLKFKTKRIDCEY